MNLSTTIAVRPRSGRRWLRLVGGLGLLLAAGVNAHPHAEPAGEELAWDSAVLELGALGDLERLVEALRETRVVLVGEVHDRYEHHLNQLAIIRGLYAQDPRMAIGLEFFQQPFQEYLDQFVAGEIDEREFLRRTEYFERWRFDYRLYRPILDFARERGIPMVALNVPGEVTSKVAREGLESLDEEQRQWVPVEIERGNRAYEERVRRVFDQHPAVGEGSFERFLDAQLLWDEGMAERAARYLQVVHGWQAATPFRGALLSALADRNSTVRMRAQYSLTAVLGSLFPYRRYDTYEGMQTLMPLAKGVSAKSHDFDAEGNDVTHVEAAVSAVDDLVRESARGDILVFMPTEQDIRETCEMLTGRGWPRTEIMPLYARLSAADQRRVFAATGARKIIVATNVAETSITIPGIRYVVDTGLARIPRYSPRTRTTALPVAPIARSSADQRMGRCGRMADGSNGSPAALGISSTRRMRWLVGLCISMLAAMERVRGTRKLTSSLAASASSRSTLSIRFMA